jgi:hypothetical protein
LSSLAYSGLTCWFRQNLAHCCVFILYGNASGDSNTLSSTYFSYWTLNQFCHNLIWVWPSYFFFSEMWALDRRFHTFRVQMFILRWKTRAVNTRGLYMCIRTTCACMCVHIGQDYIESRTKKGRLYDCWPPVFYSLRADTSEGPSHDRYRL